MHGRALSFGEDAAGRKYAAPAKMYKYPVADESKGVPFYPLEAYQYRAGKSGQQDYRRVRRLSFV
jgi:hypothetical protein